MPFSSSRSSLPGMWLRRNRIIKQVMNLSRKRERVKRALESDGVPKNERKVTHYEKQRKRSTTTKNNNDIKTTSGKERKRQLKKESWTREWDERQGIPSSVIHCLWSHSSPSSCSSMRGVHWIPLLPSIWCPGHNISSFPLPSLLSPHLTVTVEAWETRKETKL